MCNNTLDMLHIGTVRSVKAAIRVINEINSNDVNNDLLTQCTIVDGKIVNGQNFKRNFLQNDICNCSENEQLEKGVIKCGVRCVKQSVLDYALLHILAYPPKGLTLHDSFLSSNLKHVELYNIECENDLIFTSFSNLESLILGNCDKVVSLSIFRKNVNLQEMYLYNCNNLNDVTALSEFTNLTKLIISGSTNLSTPSISFRGGDFSHVIEDVELDNQEDISTFIKNCIHKNNLLKISLKLMSFSINFNDPVEYDKYNLSSSYYWSRENIYDFIRKYIDIDEICYSYSPCLNHVEDRVICDELKCLIIPNYNANIDYDDSNISSNNAEKLLSLFNNFIQVQFERNHLSDLPF